MAIRFNYDDLHADHFEYLQTLKLIYWIYYWSEISQYSKEYIDICDICHQIKSVRYKLYCKLKFFSPGYDLFTDVTMDFITDMPLYKYESIFIFSSFL